MADTLNRRSSRARATQSQSHHSSNASSASGRSTRAFAKTGSPIKTVPTSTPSGSGSLSSEPPEDPNDDMATRRRSTRGREEDRDRQPKIELLDVAPPSDEDDPPGADAREDDLQEDDESVRCICGHDEYPGPPPFDPDSKYGLKDVVEFERIFGIEITDEMAGNFVQCETCNSWQHSACVGFTTEDSTPDDVEYFCEQCRKDFHKVYTASNGQKYSIFLPVHRPSRGPSRATSATAKDVPRSPKGNGTKMSRSAAAAAAAAALSKRRSTMNSRDAAYDEEQLLKAIEASKEESVSEDTEPPGSRRPKRGRDDSEEKPEGVKRQRTHSKSPSPNAEKPRDASQDDSGDEGAMRNGHKKSRNAARSQRERAERDERRDEQERKRAEAASKRSRRADRRRADDSDPSEELPLATRVATSRATESAQPPEPPASSQPPPDTPPAAQAPVPAKKKGTSQHKKKGRNQYTKDRDNHDHDESPARSMSRDVTRNGEDGGSSHTKTLAHDGVSKNHHKIKGAMGSRVTMSDMKRRANNILEYITRTQVELVNEPLAEVKASPTQSTTDDGSGHSVPQLRINGDDARKRPEGASSGVNGALSAATVNDFKSLSCVEMMDALTRDLVKWQQEFAP
jgi:hypothetical protein